MSSRSSSRKVTSLVLAVLMLAVQMHSQSTPPAAHLAAAYIRTDSRGQPKNVRVEFEVKSDLVVSNLSISYRVPPRTEYKSSKLKQDLNLRYAGLLPKADKIEYYLTLTPDRGQSLSLLGSATSPSVVAASDLESREGDGRGVKKNYVIVITIVVGIVAAIFGIGLSMWASDKNKSPH
jgi:hypothetical protein